MSIYSFGREEWKAVNIGEGFINDARLEVSSHGRLKVYNKTSKGKIIKGSLINGYPIIRMRLFKPRDEKTASVLNELQSIYLADAKKVTEINKALKTLDENSPEIAPLAAELELAMEVLKKSKQKYSLKLKKDVKSRTTHYGALTHRLVAEHFIPRTHPDQSVVAHLDHNKTNNLINNLKWMTPAENMAHQQLSPNVIADKQKRLKSGSNTEGRSKLSVTKVMYLKKLLNEGKTISSLAKQFKITETQIIRIKKEVNWGSVEAAK